MRALVHNQSKIDFSPIATISKHARFLTGLTGTEVHSGSWLGLPDFGVTEWLQGQKSTSPASTQTEQKQDEVKKDETVTTPPGTTPQASTTKTTTTTPNGNNTTKAIDDAAKSQQDAAAKAAEARRQAALRSYQAKVGVANTAKESAKGQYDWIIDTLGSNKKDLLDQVALNQKTGEEGYAKNEEDTKSNYDQARQEILSTYRDLQLQQEKILRGTGVGSSSRSQEASLRLNNLMGKDLSETSSTEADALAMIGNALSTFKEQIVLTKNSIETETKSKLDKAALDYDSQIKAIDANLQLSANEKEDAYASAESQLATDTANIEKWAAGLKLEAETSIAKNTSTLDNFIADMTDSSKLLNTTLDEKQAATDAFVQQISTSTYLDKEGNLVTPSVGAKKTAANKTLADLYTPDGTTTIDTGAPITGADVTSNVQSDPLLGALMA